MELGDPHPAITIEPVTLPIPNPPAAPREPGTPPPAETPKREKEKTPA